LSAGRSELWIFVGETQLPDSPVELFEIMELDSNHTIFIHDYLSPKISKNASDIEIHQIDGLMDKTLKPLS
jgi:hypothetical protein